MISLLSYNIRFGGTGRADRIADVIGGADPDIVVFQEATNPRIVEQIARRTGMEAWAARPGCSTAFVSRVEIAEYDWLRPPGARHPILELKPAGTDLRIFGLHLSAVHSKWTERRRVRELRALLGDIEQHQNGYHALVGDFNALAPDADFDARRLPPRLRMLVWLSGRELRRDAIQLVHDAGYVDGYRSLHPDVPGFTFPTWDPHVRLDYVFLPEAFADRLEECRVLTEAAGADRASDHFPLLARFASP